MKKLFTLLGALLLALTLAAGPVLGAPPCKDSDKDGYTNADCGGTDCNDDDPNINPGAAEDCTNGVDDDCDGYVDCDDTDCSTSDACGTDPHADLLWDNYNSNCVSCHDTQTSDMYNSLHYQWEGDAPEMLNQPSIQQGKLNNSVNSYCVNILGDWPVCGKCHAGRGQRPDATGVGNENIDCLMCHNAQYAQDRVRRSDGTMGPPDGTDQATLDGYVRNVHQPMTENCLKCHAYAGGGDAVKRGDLSWGLTSNTDANFDVHMDTDASDLTCQACHAFVNHKVTGKGSDLRATDHASEVLCTSCHTGMDSGTGHADAGANRTDADRHVAHVACQACHVEEYAKDATETHRDWRYHHDGSLADGASGPGHPYTEKQANLQPEYLFWDRTSDNTLLHDDASLTYDAAKDTYPTSRPAGDIYSDKLYGFKYKTAYQPMVSADNRLIALDTYEYLVASGDVQKSIENGLANMGYSTTEPFEWITTDTYQLINHGVEPAANVTCAKCHDDASWGLSIDSKLDKLGYKLKDTKALICSQCHGEKNLKNSHEQMHAHIDKGSGIDCYYCHTFSRPERGLCDPCDTTCNDEFVDTNPYPHTCPPPQ